jgi:hypothetical protein
MSSDINPLRHYSINSHYFDPSEFKIWNLITKTISKLLLMLVNITGDYTNKLAVNKLHERLAYTFLTLYIYSNRDTYSWAISTEA